MFGEKDSPVEQESKRLEAMRRNPKGNWRIGDVQSLCKEFGVTCDKPKNGSHYKVSHPSQEKILTVPFKRPIKSVYIKLLVDFIDAVRSSE
ncbi:type II toxin-antitoxin system HicA family toxin [Agrobacterium sp. S2/73]|nr:type II toxin-antitoxin system HicA family toxin [Agrobacterium sp. S2/73]QXZ73840.1 type II toxin-antitoxin system HicA family toxin [Agrobacterium sp. S7/73]